MAASHAQTFADQGTAPNGTAASYDIHEIFIRKNTVADIVRALYEHHKRRCKHMSLAYICRRTGIASKGYLAYVMTGKRRLNEKYWAALCCTFKLSQNQSDTLLQRLRQEAVQDVRAQNSQGV